MINLNLSYFNHLFSVYPGPMKPLFQQILMAAFGLCLLLAVAGQIFAIVRRRRKDAIAARLGVRIFNFGLTMGLVGFLLLFFIREQAQLLSGRFWLALWLAAALIWGISIFRHLAVRLPAEKRARFRKAMLAKYLPKKKR
jgi:hypothetical protein